MKRLLYGDTFPRLWEDLRTHPGKWMSRFVLLLGPWACLWMVETLNENNVFEDLYAWQVLMNLVWYYMLFAACRLILGRNRRAAGRVRIGVIVVVLHIVTSFPDRSACFL